MGEFDEAIFERRWSNEKIGRILTRMGIFKRAKKGRSHYIVTPDKICALHKQFLVGRAVKSPSEVGDVGAKTEEATPEKTPTQPKAGGERSLKQASLSHFGRVEKVEGEVSQKPTDLNSTPTTPTSPPRERRIKRLQA
jgi:hypothetical protein